MKKAELLFTFIIALGIIFRLMHWPYANEILSLGAIFLSGLYFWFSFALLNSIRLRVAFKKESYKSISKFLILVAIGTGIVFSLLVIYSLFKLQFWPYGQVGLLQGLILFAAILLIVFVFYLKNRKQFLKINYLRFIIIGVISITLFSISTDQLVDLYYGSDPEYAEEYKTYLNDESLNKKRPTRVFKSK